MRFRNREEAGKKLAMALVAHQGQLNTIVLALPRGGVPVAFEVARALHLPLDLMLVRKLGLPGQEELALGAIADGGVCVMNEDLLAMFPASYTRVETIIEREEAELKRRSEAYRGTRPVPRLEGRTVIIVDDGIATGATMRVAVEAARKQKAHHIIVATPVASASAVGSLREKADEVICLLMPEPFYGVGGFYQHFDQTSDEEVKSLLAQSGHDGDNHERKRA